MLHFSYFLNLGRACLLVFINKNLLQRLKPFHNKSEMNTPQAEGNVNSRLYSSAAQTNCMKYMTQEKKVQHCSTNMKLKYVISA